jgi:hypothetical protein
MRGIWAGLLVLAPAMAWAQSSDEIIGAHGKLWFPKIDGGFKGSTDAIGGTSVNVRDDLGLDESENGVYDVGVWFKIPMIPIRFIFTHYAGQFEASEQLQRTIIVEGQPYLVTTTVNTDFDIRAYTLMLDIGFGFGTAPVEFNVALQAGAHLFDHEIEITGAGAAVDEQARFGLPMVGARAGVILFGMLEAFVQLQGVSTFGRSNDVDAHYYDFVFEVRWWVLNKVSVGGGYRVIEFIAEEKQSGNQDHFKVRFDGGFVSVTIRL